MDVAWNAGHLCVHSAWVGLQAQRETALTCRAQEGALARVFAVSQVLTPDTSRRFSYIAQLFQRLAALFRSQRDHTPKASRENRMAI